VTQESTACRVVSSLNLNYSKSFPTLPCGASVSDSVSVLQQLMNVIQDRRDQPPAKSYTTTLFQAGLPKIAAKLTEETAEVIEAAGEPGDAGRNHTIYEAADVLYHLWVLLAHQRITLPEVEAELARRFGISGLDEKASRPAKLED
jgi:phosphoribosyl-ATP pyrophosphohydrolase